MSEQQPYTPDLCTLDAVLRRQHLTERDDQAPGLRDEYDEAVAIIESLIHEVSADVARHCERVFMPYVATKTYGWAGREHINLRELALVGDDLLEITSVTDANGTAVSMATALPRNIFPKYRIQFGANCRMYYVESNPIAATVDGIWGYAPQYPRQWRDSGVALPGELLSSATSLTLASETEAQSFERLSYLKLGDEVVQVTARSSATLTLQRGELGTTPATHALGTPIQRYHQLADLSGAVITAVRYYYKTLNDAGGQVSIYANGAVQVEQLSRSVVGTFNQYQRRTGIRI